ncbi:hypothetical protein [Nocardia cyriacigeorgica]|uniref:hypothetical protein n=1 Tax=Nocardia cyriacigeorgica TaxID=135487 RepID=UPI002456E8C6|nr:hypothetical protein [Nocardia cyriacigeorgica]
MSNFFSNVVAGGLGAVLGTALITAVVFALKRGRVAGVGWRERRAAARAERARGRERARRQQAVQARIQRAEMAGELAPIAVSGRNPATVTYHDGSVSYFFDDQNAYVTAMRSGLYPPDRTIPCPPPVVG